MSERRKHKFIEGAECCLGNSGIPFSDGFNFYYCSCGKWRDICKGNAEGRIAHSEHLQKIIESAPAAEKGSQ